MSLLPLLFAPLLSLQGVGDAVVAIENDTPETWTVEYPRLIQPYVADYRRCLVGQNRRVTGEADFERQHRADLPACEAAFDKALTASNAALAGRENYTDFTAQDVRDVFEHIGRIHIARGADLDNQFRLRLQRAARARAEYEDTKPPTLVLELLDASVVKARTDATAASAEAAMENDDAIN